MSRLFPDTVYIGIYADGVVLARMRPLLGGRKAVRHVEPVAPGASDLATGVAALDALEAALKEGRWHGAQARILVSNALVRYSVIPAGAHVLSAEEEIALARLKFQQVHGGALADWEVRLGGMLSGKDQIAAAFQRAWLDRLLTMLKAARLRVRSIEPLLMRAFNHMHARLAGRDFWFAQAEPGLLMLTRVQRGNWVSVTGSQLQGPVALALPAQLREAKLLEGGADSPRRVYVCVHGMDCGEIAAGPDTEYVDLAQSRAMRYSAAERALGLALGG